jgi:hypothetical protein
MTLSTEAVEKLKGNNKAMAALMAFFDRSSQTLENWLKEPVDIRLTAPDAVKIICETTGLKPKEVLTESVEA